MTPRIFAPLLLLVVTACASTKGESFVRPGFDFMSVGNVAVVSGETTTFDVHTRQTLLDTFQFEFMKRGWKVVERADIQTAVDELQFQNSEFTSPLARGQVGNISNVSALVVVNSRMDGGDMSITAKMLDPQTGELLWVGQGDASVNTGMSTLAGAVLGAAAGAAVDEGTGTTVGAGVGGAIGYGLSPNALENAKELVRDIMETVPERFPGTP